MPFTGLTLGAIKSALGSVPREAWYAISAFAVWWFASSHYINEGREEIYTELREAEKAAIKKAQEARLNADKKSAERKEQEAKIIGEQLDAIQQAEANNENSLDAIF